jgi:hypothetical protein
MQQKSIGNKTIASTFGCKASAATARPANMLTNTPVKTDKKKFKSRSTKANGNK